ncbi:MAG: DUF5665 domain-containing protein [Peptococcia bacterium]|jgi:hypothetical protein
MESNKSEDTGPKSSLEGRVKELALAMEKMKFAEYVEYINDTKRMLVTNFLAGIARGLGMAIGFTILGALLLYLLRQLVVLNLPLIGDFIAQIVELVNDSMQNR